mmetsp:Transcript_39261/g.57750  ORF Transcript_39261/g.57750 Transcript_39261/m.57750 type:complete len:283 (-) Transcript_39261:397-1245(-)|eukprot:CAMPEP_0195514194 /NCGR_PEP_ID=MMETSP0794_2-20130614/5646_1 /TAXON_ID=515487 /ORGANISM="Stephanopyxis turris, Strain CCMP 815" /LENGTH=282 /DNA_ID=CAMNT_0040642383 /DNA_START=127 /DNA_END=975 /DNA_ORIENTATION=-
MRENPELWVHVVSRRWSQSILRANTHPHEARYHNSRGDTVLHLACNFDPPSVVARALLSAYPEATSRQNEFGCTPLHLACRGSSETVVGQLLKANMNVIHTRNNGHDTPFSLLCWPRVQKDIIKKALDLELLPEQSPKHLLSQDDELARIWNSACLLAKAAYHNSVSDPLPSGKTWRMVHACAGIKDCPLNLLQLAMKLHPNQIEESDEEGKFPLNLAIQSGKRWEDGIETILVAYPSAITRQDKSTCLYPFMMAAVGYRSSLTCIYNLLQACPELERFMGT